VGQITRGEAGATGNISQRGLDKIKPDLSLQQSTKWKYDGRGYLNSRE